MIDEDDNINNFMEDSLLTANVPSEVLELAIRTKQLRLEQQILNERFHKLAPEWEHDIDLHHNLLKRKNYLDYRINEIQQKKVKNEINKKTIGLYTKLHLNDIIQDIKYKLDKSKEDRDNLMNKINIKRDKWINNLTTSKDADILFQQKISVASTLLNKEKNLEQINEQIQSIERKTVVNLLNKTRLTPSILDKPKKYVGINIIPPSLKQETTYDEEEIKESNNVLSLEQDQKALSSEKNQNNEHEVIIFNNNEEEDQIDQEEELHQEVEKKEVEEEVQQEVEEEVEEDNHHDILILDNEENNSREEEEEELDGYRSSSSDGGIIFIENDQNVDLSIDEHKDGKVTVTTITNNDVPKSNISYKRMQMEPDSSESEISDQLNEENPKRSAFHNYNLKLDQNVIAQTSNVVQKKKYPI